jgi:2-polyprenyl-3-methyl-5-hydroxy-6-metoxy-1,4-benzoquinol methylase
MESERVFILFYRAGRKLEAALDHFGIDVKGRNILDSGISTGGFTDCLLQRGAASVIGVDVGYGQVHTSTPHAFLELIARISPAIEALAMASKHMRGMLKKPSHAGSKYIYNSHISCREA